MAELRTHLTIIVLGSCVLLSAGCAQTSQEPSPEPASTAQGSLEGAVEIPAASLQFIEVERLETKSNAAVMRAPARVAFRDGAVSRLGAPLPGRVEEVHVQTGEHVEAGDPLVTLDCPEAASSRAALSTARAARREALAALERQQRMSEQGVGTERELLEAERRLAEAEAELTRAGATVRFVGSSKGTKVVLRSPIAGTIVSRSATVGAAVEAGGDPLVEVGDPAALWVVANVFDRDLHLVREGMRAQIDLPAIGEPIAGQVVSLGPVVEGSARTAPVRIALDQPNPSLRPGMFGRVRIESPDQALALPTAAVLIKDQETLVYVEQRPGVFVPRPVEVGPPVEGRVVVRSGVSAGEPVVIRGALLIDGAAGQLL